MGYLISSGFTEKHVSVLFSCFIEEIPWGFSCESSYKLASDSLLSAVSPSFREPDWAMFANVSTSIIKQVLLMNHHKLYGDIPIDCLVVTAILRNDRDDLRKVCCKGVEWGYYFSHLIDFSFWLIRFFSSLPLHFFLHISFLSIRDSLSELYLICRDHTGTLQLVSDSASQSFRSLAWELRDSE